MMKKLLWATLFAASALTTHPTLCMESDEYSSDSQEHSGEEQRSNKRAKLKLSTDEQHKINASLIEAVVNNDIQKAVNCLKSGATIYRNCIDSQDANMEDYLTPETILKATGNDYQDIANSFDPLALAAKFGYIDMIKAIIDYVPKDTFVDVLGDALLAALLNNNLEIIKFLISRKTSPYYCRYGDAPILSFIENTTSTQALSLILEDDAYADDIDDMDPNGYTGLWCSATCGNTAAVKLLLVQGASLRACEVFKNDRYYDRDNHNALQAALTRNHPDTALCILKHFMPSHDLYPADAYKTDAYKKLKVLLVGFYKKDESNPSNLTKLPKDLLYTIISYTPELIFNKKLLVQIISRNRYNKPLVSNCNDDFQEVQPLLESMARLKLNEQDKTVLKEFKSSSIFFDEIEPKQKDTSNPEKYDTSNITDLEKKNLLDALLNPNTTDNDQCYQTLFAMNFWDDLQKKNAPAASKDTPEDAKPSNENISNSIDRTHNSGKQEE